MSGTKKTINFIISFFATILFLSIISNFLSPLLFNLNNLVYEIISLSIYTLSFLFFMFMQNLLRHFKNSKIIEDNKEFLSLKTSKYSITEKLWIHVFILIIYFLPVLRTQSFNSFSLTRLVMFIISITLIELLIRYSDSTMQVHFLRKGIVILGTDIRIGAPIMYGKRIYNDSGYYSYNDIKEYFIFPDRVELYLIHDQGKIIAKVNNENKNQLKGLFQQQKIPMKRFR
ncbi:MAG: hypothetical protein FH753_13200 [Firmicutes bacterium]|nr:hypothetical protein [Bacillota bacterium]MTI71538.1 hypothetical protein [Bacillota bacterium]